MPRITSTTLLMRTMMSNNMRGSVCVSPRADFYKKYLMQPLFSELSIIFFTTSVETIALHFREANGEICQTNEKLNRLRGYCTDHAIWLNCSILTGQGGPRLKLIVLSIFQQIYFRISVTC